ncbi:hypothetical protein MDAP_001490 [Mitosporidium daphniae]|uniref:tRNA (cytosine(38)-C(5))-methyltransferase n=1 Tax=Mitosporidium daphniae TaxID=1485682 RepID=A0A098VSR3_9MICR|nr:uncharacterized protein DI09_226p20 [Mitosporidium daphniae]KGG52015.1 hypothetical protein DI09_226p20 [Mitosporidium daphniae]|eukprot:XP_013238451.1 uncharacterized protein DI09_226p20 [Mitosporidium daphniae]
MSLDDKIIIEWFSGIGGMRFALEALLMESQSKPWKFISFDINEVANSVYTCSFNGELPRTKSIEALSMAEIESLNGYIWLLSPPCQPYTLGGSQLDEKDSRASAILHLIAVLKEMKTPPAYLFLENVPRFENSATRSLLVEALVMKKYSIEEFLLAPTDAAIAIPNSRRRYYLLAKRASSASLPPTVIESLKSVGYTTGQFSDGKHLSDYIEKTCSENLIVPSRLMERESGFRFDVISANGVPFGHRSEISGPPACSTFTKGYGSNRIRGTGSLVLLQEPETPEIDTTDVKLLLKMGVRYFSAEEIASLHAFPTIEGTSSQRNRLKFPDHITLIQKYRLLGNSLNVRVVSILLSRLLSLPFQISKDQ